MLLLRPREGVIEPAPVRAAIVLQRGASSSGRSDFRGPQLALYGWPSLGVEGARARAARRAARRGALRAPLPPPGARRGGRRRAAVAGAARSRRCRCSAVARQRAIDVGLSTQAWADWARDLVKAWAIGAVFAGAAARPPRSRSCAACRAAGGSPGRRSSSPSAWPRSTSARSCSTRSSTGSRRCPTGATRSDVLELARGPASTSGEVYEVDASRRTTGANAYVAGLGRTKRVVLYDNLLEDFTRDEVRLVVAHELGHVHYRDVPARAAVPGDRRAVRPVRRRAADAAPGARGGRAPGPGVLPALALSRARADARRSRRSPTSSRAASRRAPTPSRSS